MSTPTSTPRTDAVVTKSMQENGGAYLTEDLLLHARTLETELAAMTACAKKLNEECELWEIRCGSIICSGVLDSYTGADLQKWEDEFKKKRGDLIARAEKAETELDAEREKVRVLREALEVLVENGGIGPESMFDNARAAIDAYMTKEASK